MRKTTSTVCGSPQKCIDNCPTPLLFKAPRSRALVPRNTGCPLSLKLNNMCSATSSHFPFGLYVCDPYHLFSDPSPRRDQCPCANHFAHPATVLEFATHHSLFPFLLYKMFLYIDMKILLPVNCSSSHCVSAIIFWISARICNAVNPWKFFHSSSIGLLRRFDPTLDIEVYLLTTQSQFSMRLRTQGMDSSCPDTIRNRRIHRLLLLIIGLLC